MEEIEIKNEFGDCTVAQCRGCLSIGRKLLPISKYFDVYKKLVKDYIYTNTNDREEIKLCWECHTQLRKAFIFRQKVIKANELIQYGQSYVYGTLSCLTTVTINDTHVHSIYVNAANYQTANNDKQLIKNVDDIENGNLKSNENNDELKCNENNDELKCNENNDELKCNENNDEFKSNENNDESNNYESNDHFNDDIGDVDNGTQNDDKNEGPSLKKETTVGTETVIIKRKIVSKWAEKRALQNKKPKFKIISYNELVVDKIFRRFKINEVQLKECLSKERDCNSFKTSRYKCDGCVIILKNECSLLKHNMVRHNEDAGAYECDICHAKMSKTDLQKHVKRHYFRYECSICKALCCKSKLATHLKDKHRNVFRCVKCDLMFSSRQDFFRHFKDWHEKFVCHHCGVSFKMRYCIKDHLRKQHSPFECPPCGKRFARYNGLWLHNKLRHAPPLPTAYCVECDRQYRDVYRYRWHLANSTRHKPKKKVRVPCPECEKVFTKRIYMTNHYEFVHLKQFRYRCEVCDKNFIRNADLVKHRRKVHEGIPPPKNKICYVCGKGFHTNKILTNHLRTHTGERPFACAACPARFAQRAALRGHQRALHPPVQ